MRIGVGVGVGRGGGAALFGLGHVLEGGQSAEPHLFERDGEGAEGGLVERVDLAATVTATLDEAGVEQNGEVLADGGERNGHVGREIAGGALGVPEQPHEFLAAGLGEGGNGRGSGHENILAKAKMLSRPLERDFIASAILQVG